MDLSEISIEDIEGAFSDFYRLMMASDHFRVFFSGQAQVEKLIKLQSENFYQSFSMTDEAFEENYLKLGLMHAHLKLPFEDMVSSLSMVRDNLLKNTSINQKYIYSIIEKMERSLAKGYLVFEFQDVLAQLEFSVENVKKTYAEADQERVIRPLNWLAQIIKGFQADKPLLSEDIQTADKCALTPMIEEINIEQALKQRILISHSEQHALGMSMAYFYRNGDYMLASFMFSKLFAITVSLSNQIGLAVSQQAIEKLHFDSLTGLLMRRSLEGKLNESIQQAARLKQSVAVIMMDLDHFKNINDTWGHQAGDRVLSALGSLIKRNQRADDLAFRYGGEEFLLFLPNISLENTQGLGNRLRQQVEALEIEWHGDKIPLTVSVGAVVLAPSDFGLPLESFIDKADQNLYKAKASGRNQVVASLLT